MSHACHASGCSIPVPPERLMCRRHWYMVHPTLRKEVWAEYRPGQCDDQSPSEEWHRAADAAIGYVAIREGRQATVAQANALADFKVRG